MAIPSPDGTAQQRQGEIPAQLEPMVRAALDLFEITERRSAALLLGVCHETFNRRLLLDEGSDDDIRDSAIEMLLKFRRHARVILWLLEELDHQPKLAEVPWVVAVCNAGSLVTADYLTDEEWGTPGEPL